MANGVPCVDIRKESSLYAFQTIASPLQRSAVHSDTIHNAMPHVCPGLVPPVFQFFGSGTFLANSSKKALKPDRNACRP